MRFSNDKIEEVREKSDIVDIISQHVKLKRSGSNYSGLCPFHNEKTPSFSVSPSRQMYHCFGCGKGGNVITFVMEYENFTFPEAVQALAERAGVDLPKLEYSKEAKEKADRKTLLLEIQKEAATFFYFKLRQERGKIGYRYLRERGLSDETMKQFGLGYSDRYSGELYKHLKSKKYSDELLKASGLFNFDEKYGMTDKFYNRVIFPIMDVNNKVIGFGGRVMGDGKPKYLNSPETDIFDKSRNLYGLNLARKTRKNYMILCEGYMDVIAMHQAGFTNAVASLGTALTPGHAGLLKRYTKEVLLLYDSDEAGIRAALRGIPILKEAGIVSRVVSLKPYKDPDEFIKNLGPEAFEERLNQAMDSFMFRVSVSEQQYDMREPQGQNSFFEYCASILLELADELERNLYIEAIVRNYGKRYGVTTEDLRARVNKMALRGTPAENRVAPKPVSGPVVKAKENGSQKAQKLVITWMTSDDRYMKIARKYLEPSDFTERFYGQIVEKLYRQADEGKLNPARLLNEFTDSQDQEEVAALFHATIPLEKEELESKAFADSVLRVREDGLNEKMNVARDFAELTRLMEQKKDLERLKKDRSQILLG